jgi:hypothetical protein
MIMHAEKKDAPVDVQVNVPAVANDSSQQLVAKSQVDTSNFAGLPDLSKAEEIPVDLNIEYWDPEKVGEKRRGVFIGFTNRTARDFEDPNVVVDIECATFITKENNVVLRFCNGSARLVSVFKNSHSNYLNAALEIEFKGDTKNKTNQYRSQVWSVKPLIIKR